MQPRLESWKAIAEYLRRDVRTVQRWEKDEGLPVHRHVHRSGGTVYAFAEEVDGWWASRRAALEEAASPGSPGPVEAAQEPPADTVTRGPGRGRNFGVAVVVVALAAAALGGGALWRQRRAAGAAHAADPREDQAAQRRQEALQLIARARTLIDTQEPLPWVDSRRVWDPAEALLGAGVGTGPEFAVARTWWAWAGRGTGRAPQEVLARAEEAERFAGALPPSDRYWVVGSAQFLRGQHEDAVRSFSAMVEAAPGDAWAHRRLAMALTHAFFSRTQPRYPRRAASALARAAELRPTSYAARFWAAQALLGTGVLEEGDRQTEAAAQLAGGNPERMAMVHLLRAYSHWVRGDGAAVARSLGEADASLSGVSDADGVWNPLLACFELSIGRLRAAEARFARRGSTWRDLAWIGYLRGDQAAVRRAVDLRRPEDDVNLITIWIASQAGSPAVLRPLIAKHRASGGAEKLSEPTYAMAEAALLHRAGRSAEALEGAQRAWEMLGTAFGGAQRLTAAMTLAEIRSARGDTAGAAAPLEIATRESEWLFSGADTNADIWMLTLWQLARTYRALGRNEPAAEIEAHLRGVLAVGDADHRMVRALRVHAPSPGAPSPPGRKRAGR